MKISKILCFVSLVLIGNICSAQPVLTYSNNAYQVGELFSVLKCNYQNPGLNGANQLWNFSSVTPIDTQIWTTQATTISFASSSVALNIELFDSTNIRKYYYSFFNDSAYGHSDEILCVEGYVSTPLKYPFALGDLYYNVCGFSTYDAFGTLQLPQGTFNNVVRIKSISSSSVRGILGGGINNEFIGYTHDTTYFWYLPNTHFPIAKSINLWFPHKVSGIVVYYITKNFYYLNGVATSVSEITPEFKGNIYPNPTNGSLTINSRTELKKIEVVAITGQVLLSEVPTNVSHTLQLDNFANGIYFVNLYQNNCIVKREKVVLNK